MGKRSFVDFGRRLLRPFFVAEQAPDFGKSLASLKPSGAVRVAGIPVVIPAGMQVSTSRPLGAGERVVVLREDEGIVPMSVVEWMNEVADEVDWWTERGLWVEGQRGIPNAKAAREYIEELEAEAEELRRGRDLGDPVEELT